METSTKKSLTYSLEVRERAVLMVFEHRGEHASRWAAIESIAGRIGCTAPTLCNWVCQAERERVAARHHQRRPGVNQGAVAG